MLPGSIKQGDLVSYIDKDGKKVEGIVTKINGSATVQSENDLISVPLEELTKELG
jgi:hypothetical protein